MTAKPLDTATIVLGVLLGLAWLIMAAKLFEYAGKEAHGDASMGQALNAVTSFVLVCVTWLLLGGLLLKAQGAMPAWAGLVGMLLYFFSGASALVAVGLAGTPQVVWPIAIPIAVPVLLAGYAIGLTRVPLNPTASGVVVLSAVLALSLAPWPSLFRSMEEKEQRRIARAKENEKSAAAAQVNERQEALARIAAMPRDSHVWDWFSLLEEKSGVREEAFAELRKKAGRQADMEYMLGENIVSMEFVAHLDLKYTPALCSGAVKWCQLVATESRRKPGGEATYYEQQGYLLRAMPGLHWLSTNGCELKTGIAQVKEAVGTFGDTPQRKQLLEELGTMQ